MLCDAYISQPCIYCMCCVCLENSQESFAFMFVVALHFVHTVVSLPFFRSSLASSSAEMMKMKMYIL